MIIEKSIFNKAESKYQCDRCGAQTNIEGRKGIYVTNGQGAPRKKWDLCIKCYHSLIKGIEKKKKED